MTEADIILRLANYGDHVRRYELMLPNVYTSFDNEADLFCVRKSGLCDEFEIKVSRADFLNDSKKFIRYRDPDAHERRQAWDTPWKERFKLPNYKQKHQALQDGDMPINYFWFATPEGLVQAEEVPAFAGFIEVLESGLRVKRDPIRLHRNKMPMEERYKIARKTTYRYWKLRNQAP